MKKLLAPALAALLMTAAPAKADDTIVLVELFTSQGCSSCPPADKNLAALAERDDVIALSMHVTYWDYLGWRDTFGRDEHTRRQVAYRDIMGARVIYTPQVVVHGVTDVPGHKGKAIDAAIDDARAKGSDTKLDIISDGGMVKAVLAATDVPERCTVWIASYTKSATVQIQRGENAGREITYHNVVTKLMCVGNWDGTAQNVALPDPGAGEGVAVWIQDSRTGKVLAAQFIEN